jgi:signal transduction histidine kinase
MPQILCVDDEARNISLLKAMLVPRGYEVIEASNGPEALEGIRSGRIDICLLDVMMPGMDGFEVCRRIKADDCHRNIPVVMVTSLTDKANHIRGIEAGADDFISKPFDSAEVLARIKMLLNVKLLNDKLEAANIELEAFNYSVSHDLRKPLTLMNGYIYLLKDNFHDIIDEESKAYIQKIEESAMRMNQLIDTLLNFSLVAQVEIHREKFDLSNIAHKVSLGLKDSAPERQISFKIAGGITADGDADLCRVVLDNLMGNAWKYYGNQSELVIEFGVTDVENIRAFFVKDNGQGFEMALADKLFTPFQRLPGTNVAGHGIGLATVERIIRRHGGRVWAESEPTKGATFFFTLE